MSTALAIQPDFLNFITIKKDGSGAEINPDIPFEAYEAAVREIGNEYKKSYGKSRQCMLILFDLLNAAESAFGESYAQVIEDTGLSEKTISNGMWIASRVPADERNPALSLGHLELVAGIKSPEDRKALEAEIVAEDLTVAEARTRRWEKFPSKRTKSPAKPKATGKAQDEPQTALGSVEHAKRCQEAIDWLKGNEAFKPIKSWPVAEMKRWAPIWAEFRRMERRAGLGHGVK